MVNNLEQMEPTTFNDLTRRQMRRKSNRIKWTILKKLVEVVAGSVRQIHQEAVIAKLMNELQPHTSPWKKLRLLVEKIEDLSTFKDDPTQNKLNNAKNATLDLLVRKMSGCGDQKTRGSVGIKAAFLQSRFQKCFELN